MERRREFVVNGKRCFAGQKHDDFEMGKEKKRVNDAEKENKQIGVREVRKMEKQKNYAEGDTGCALYRTFMRSDH